MVKLKSNVKKIVLGVSISAGLISFTYKEDLFQTSKNLDIFASLYKELNINYVDEVNSSKIMKTGIDAMLESLDPYTEFVPESEIEDYRMKYVSTQYGGIGTSIQNRGGRFFVADTFEGFPAQKADIRAGDELIAINDVSLSGKIYEQVSSLLKGPKGTPVKILIKRNNESSALEKNIIREEISQPNVSYAGMLEHNVGYIKLDKFLESSAEEVKTALTNIQRNNPAGLVLDLRSNGGGILQEAVKIVNFFVEANTTVVAQKGRNREKTITYRTINAPLAPNLPLVVLINNRSASAAEIVAGSLQDLDRAVVIGQRSFGKGLVQQTFNLPYNSLVKVTVAKYYTPSGRCIQALDYTHRNNEGGVEKVADSLITEYKTKAGRSVYDGSGVYPDLFVKPFRYSSISQTLVNRYLIFDFATEYVKTHPTVGEAKSFKLSEADYSNFVNYLSDKDYNYSTRTERILNELKSEAEKENKLAEVKAEFDAFKSKLSVSKKNDLSQFKDEIRRILENEIAGRYYFQKGRIEHGFQYDEDIKTAYKVLGNKNLLASILQGSGNYKSIGKPGDGYSASIGEN
ncbi:S41 family peptidase [Pedobacter sp. SYSU D00535]|uniref:S41 family peptidase n=1 Tax=Pedobacter sp. SYSU D00535 TaxID=2810308 RepID=UPI001A967601|nr:S41 family peptidase [Pedobacter sp. SYSU D00535]